MKSTGITRPLDKLGRIVIPMELRRSFKLEIGDPIEIYTDEDKIILKKHKVGCFRCGEINNLKLMCFLFIFQRYSARLVRVEVHLYSERMDS
jgi:transcriptional pleiotropic regulator of transition state genes